MVSKPPSLALLPSPYGSLPLYHLVKPQDYFSLTHAPSVPDHTAYGGQWGPAPQFSIDGKWRTRVTSVSTYCGRAPVPSNQRSRNRSGRMCHTKTKKRCPHQHHNELGWRDFINRTTASVRRAARVPHTAAHSSLHQTRLHTAGDNGTMDPGPTHFTTSRLEYRGGGSWVARQGGACTDRRVPYEVRC